MRGCLPARTVQWLAGLAVLGIPSMVSAAADSTTQAAHAILQKHCLSCHGAGQMSGLDLRQRETLLKGGSRGPAVVVGDAPRSLLYRAAAHLSEPKMPPGSRRPLPQGDLAILKEWIEAGAPDPEAGAATGEPSWWSMRKPQRPPIPALKERPANPIDAFILAKLREKGLEPAPVADKATLLRRAYFDLVGLPPTPAQADRFLKNTSPNAFEELIDELLASSHYGQRWGRHWLDVVRYADSAGFEGDVFYPNAWRYRDYVIKSFNEDKPYDRFVQEQIAGDELFPNNMEMEGFYDISPEKLEHLEARIGTTLYTFGPEIQESHLDAERLRYERLTDAVDTTAAAFMGLTLECSRCHDHKFDPLTQKDYFQLQAVFAASSRKTIPVVSSLSAGHRREDYHRMIALTEARASYQRFEKQVKDRVIEIKKKDYPPEVVRAYEVPMKERTAKELELAAPLTQFYTAMEIANHLTDEEKKHHQDHIRKLATTVLDIPLEDASHRVKYDGFFDVPSATVLGQLKPELVPDTYLLNRGELSLKREVVDPGLPAALRDGTVSDPLPAGAYGPRYRKQFALWLTRPTHPLTARVMVNRIWQGHFRKGLVRTSNDFGRQGDRPSHPELLDWLATEFVDRGWSVKSMHRLIMLSDTYQTGQPLHHRCPPAAGSRKPFPVAHEPPPPGRGGGVGFAACGGRQSEPDHGGTACHSPAFQGRNEFPAHQALVGRLGRPCRRQAPRRLYPGPAQLHLPHVRQVRRAQLLGELRRTGSDDGRPPGALVLEQRRLHQAGPGAGGPSGSRSRRQSCRPGGPGLAAGAGPGAIVPGEAGGDEPVDKTDFKQWGAGAGTHR